MAIRRAGVQAYRYPDKRIDSTTDYLSITIKEYMPDTNLPGLLGNKPTGAQGGQGSDSSKKSWMQKAGSAANWSKASDRVGKSKTKGIIYLPIPQGITDNNSTDWGDSQITAKDAIVMKASSEIMQNPGQAWKDMMNTAGVGGIDANTKAAINAWLGSAAANALGGNVSAADIISRSTGQVLNPNLETIFRGVHIRQFGFSFDLAPRSTSESQQVKGIIRKFKQHSAAKSTSQNSGNGIFIKAPDVFQLEYRQGRGKHPFLNTFKPMVLSSMNTNYTGSGTYTTYHDGTPVKITMTLNFTELNPIYSEDYDSEATIGVGF